MDTAIGDGQSPYMPNVNLDDGGKPTKRRGQMYVYTNSLGNGQINGMFDDLFNGKKVFAWNTGLYTQVGSADPVLIYNSLSNKKGYFYVFNDYLYYKNQAEFIKIDSSFNVTSAMANAYIPTVAISSPPTGGGTANEQRNLIQPGQTKQFSGNGTATAYTLPEINLDATAAKATVNGVAKTEGTDFTVNRTTGIVTFNAAPSSGTNNVLITYYKTYSGSADKITKSFRSTLYGGATNDSRIFCCGNPDYKNIYFYTGLTGNTNTDATYWPEFNFNQIGSSAKNIYAWSDRRAGAGGHRGWLAAGVTPAG
jgi:hypothetical protein